MPTLHDFDRSDHPSVDRLVPVAIAPIESSSSAQLKATTALLAAPKPTRFTTHATGRPTAAHAGTRRPRIRPIVKSTTSTNTDSRPIV